MKISQTVFKLQSGHDFVTDRRTDDQGKNNMSPNPTGGDIMNIHEFANKLFCIFEYHIKGQSLSFHLIPILLVYDQHKLRYG